MLKVKEYMKSIGKSITYAASDVLSEQYETAKQFTSTNQEVFKEAYTTIKDYRHTYTRVRDQIQKSDIYVAANLGINNLISDLKNGKFYNKDREAEYTVKYGGDLMSDSGWDMDAADFDWDDKTEVTEGEKIIATAIKKNNKMSTFMMADAMAQGHKAIIDSSRENTTLLYIQQEKIFNKIGGGIDNITSLLKSSTENNAKVQNQQMKNTVKFFTNMEKKTDKIVAQLDEMIQMQRNLYQNELNKEKERKRNTVTDVMSNGVPDIKEYFKIVKGNINEQINQFTGGVGSMGEALGGSNMFAMIMANPLGELMKSGMKRGISSEFKKASKEFDKSIKGYFSTIISKLNNARNNEEDGFAKLLGNIFGMKVDKEKDNIDTSRYNRGPIPFDGITKKSITEVIPYYLRKMTSILTGEDEKVFDYKTGRWTTIRAVQKQHNDWKNAGAKAGLSELTSLITEALGRNPERLMSSFDNQKRFKENYEKLTNALYRSNGDLSILNQGMSYGIDQEFLETIKAILRDEQYIFKKVDPKNDLTGRRAKYKEAFSGKIDRTQGARGLTGKTNTRITLSNIARNIFETKASRADSQRSMEKEADLIERILYSEGIAIDPDSKNNNAIRTKHGDYNIKTAFNSPLAQAMKFVEDDHGNTLFNYLQGIKRDLTAIRVSGLSLLGVTTTGNNQILTSNEMNFEKGESKRNAEQLRYHREQGGDNYYKWKKSEDKERESYDKRYEDELRHWKEKKNGSASPRRIDEYKDILGYLIDQNETNLKNEKDKLKNQKTIYDILADWDFLKKEEAEKLKKIEYDENKKMKDNLSSYKGAEKIALIHSYANKLVQKPWEAATDAVVSLDKWISNLFFGKSLRKTKEDEEDEEKGLLMRMKESIQDGFHNIVDSISDKVGDWMEKWGEKIKEKTDPITKWLFGEKVDSETPRSGGVFGGFIGHIESALKKNGEDVAKYLKEEALKAKNKVLGKDEESSDNTTSSSNIVKKSLSNKEAIKLMHILIDNGIFTSKEEYNEYYKYCKENKFSFNDAIKLDNINIFLIKSKSNKNIESSIGSNVALNAVKINKNKKNKKRDSLNFENNNDVKNFIKDTYFNKNQDKVDEYYSWANSNGITDNYELTLETNIKKFKSKNKTNNTSLSKKYTKITSDNKFTYTYSDKGKQEFKKIYDEIEGSTAKERLENARKKIAEQEKATQENTNALDKLTSPIEKIAKYLQSIAEKLGATPIINTPTNQHARGGINRTGKAFTSVVSSGEIINGNVVPPGGPYITTIPKNGVVINPADESTMNRQAAQERSFINKLKFNAKANDGLEKATVVEYMKNEENQKFAADIIAKGGIGFGVGLLLGQPLLAAGIGIASGFSKKSNGFANAIFGTASGFDENGNVTERRNDGLLSTEIQKAIPDIKKFGLGGAIAGLITPFGPVGGLLIGSALGFAKNNGMVQDVLFGPDGVFKEETKNKFKKALPNMAIGATAGALLGPFGLVPGAILGATAGYVTSMDKFKEALFGKEVDTGVLDKDGNPITHKEGGLLGAIRKGMDPLKNFGQTLVTGLTDAIFGKKTKNTGKKDEDGNPIMEREGGIFGLVKDQIINPIAEGIKPIIQESKLMFNKTTKYLTKSIKNYMDDHIGGHLGSRLGKVGESISRAGIKVGTSALWVGASPLMLGARAIQGIGSGLRRKQIRRGEADDMTAAERLAYRDKSNFLVEDGDDYYDTDKILADLSKNSSIDELKQLRSAVLYNQDEQDELGQEDVLIRKNFDKKISNYMDGTNSHRIMKILNRGVSAKNYNKIEKILNEQKNLTPEVKQMLLKELNKVKIERNKVSENRQKLNKMGESGINEYLKSKGLNLDIHNKKSVDKLANYLNTEIIHKEAMAGEDEDDPLVRNTTELGENTSVLKELKEVLEDNIRVYIGHKEEIAKKYNLKYEESELDSKFKKEEKIGGLTLYDPEFANRQQMHQDFINNQNQEKLDKEKQIKEKKIEEIKEQLVEEATNIWMQACNKAFLEQDPDLSGNYKIVLDDVIYTINKDNNKQNDEEFKYYIKNYIDKRIQNPKTKNIILKRISQISNFFGNRMGVGKTVTMLGLLASPLGPATYGYLMYKGVRKVQDMNKRGELDNIKDTASKAAKWTKDKFYRKSTDRDLAKKAYNLWDKLSEEEKSKLNEEEWINKKIKELKEKGSTSGLLSKPIDFTKTYVPKAAKWTKNKFYRKSTDTDLERKANRAWNRLSPEEQANYDKDEWINKKIKELKEKGSTSGILGKPVELVKSAKSGIQNFVASALNNVKKKGKDADKIDKIIDAIHKLPKKIGRAMVGEEGKRNGLLHRIFGISKYVIGVPLLVGFMEKHIVPFIKNKVGPLFAGTKNSEGNYEGGIFSDVINPLNKKFGYIFDWFQNEGEYSDPDKGLSGFGYKILDGLGSAFNYAIDTWLVGAETITQKWLPWAIENLITNLPKALGTAIVATVKGIGNWFIPGNAKANSGLTPITVSNSDYLNLADGEVIDLGNGRTIYKNTNVVQDAYNLQDVKASDVNYSSYSSRTFGGKLLTNFGRGLVSSPYRGANKLAGKTLSLVGKGITKLPGGLPMKTIGNTVKGFGNIVQKSAISKSQITKTIQNAKFYKDYIKENGMAGIKDVVSEVTSDIKTKKTKPKMGKMEKILDKVDTVKTKTTKIKDTTKNLTDKGKNLFKNRKNKVVKNIAEEGLEEVGEKALKKGAKEVGEKAIKEGAEEIGEKALKTAAGKKGGIIKKIIGKIGDVLNSLVGSGKFKGYLKKASKTAASEAGEKGLKAAIKKLLKKISDFLVKKGLKTLTEGLSKLTSKLAAGASTAGIATVAFILIDFVDGAANARNILQIIEEDIDWGDRIIAGLCQVISGFLIIIPESLVCELLLMTVGQFLFKSKTEDIKKDQKYAKKALADWNAKNGTKATLEDYNRSFNGNWRSSISSGLSNAWRWIRGKKKLKDYSKDYERIPSREEYEKSIEDNKINQNSYIITGRVSSNAYANDKLSPFNLNNIAYNAKANDQLNDLDQIENYLEADTSNKIKGKKKSKKISTKDILLTTGGALLGGPVGALAGYGLSKSIDKKKEQEKKKVLIDNSIIDTAKNTKIITQLILRYIKSQNIQIATNAKADDKLMKINPKNKSDNFTSYLSDSVNKTLDQSTKNLDQFAVYAKKFDKQNQSVNSLINTGKIDPSSSEFWTINTSESGNELIDSMLKMNEYFKRLIRAPFAMASETMGNIGNVMGNTESNSSKNTTSSSKQDTSSKKTSIWSKIKSGFKSVFGFGKDDDENIEKYGRANNHIYQRDYKGSYQTKGDLEKQTIADSGCGPAAAATVLNRYGKNGNIINAANYASKNGFKEVNGGTYPEYFNNYLSQKGISAKQTKSNKAVIQSLMQGKPVIMMGQDHSNSGKSPYGSKYSHYVVATGLDNRGNIIVEDSEDRRGQTKYNLVETLKNTTIKMTTSAHGKYGRASSFANTSLTSVLANYSNNLVKGIYGPYYEALFANDNTGNSSSSSTSNSGSTSNNTSNKTASVKDSADVEERKKSIWNFLVSQGFSKNLTAAIMGNMKRESGFDPTAGEIASGDGSAKSILQMTHPEQGYAYGCGWGLCQWSYNYGHAALYNWCQAHNMSADTLEGQLNYLVAGFKGIDTDSAVNSDNTSKFGHDGSGVLSCVYSWITEYGGLSKLNSLSIEDAVVAFYDLYERGANRESDLAKSIPWAKEIYEQFANSGSGRGKKLIPEKLYSNKIGKGRYGLGNFTLKGKKVNYTTNMYNGEPIFYNGHYTYFEPAGDNAGWYYYKDNSTDDLVKITDQKFMDTAFNYYDADGKLQQPYNQGNMTQTISTEKMDKLIKDALNQTANSDITKSSQAVETLESGPADLILNQSDKAGPKTFEQLQNEKISGPKTFEQLKAEKNNPTNNATKAANKAANSPKITTDEADTQKAQQTKANTSGSLLTQIGTYASNLMKGIYGDYWTALFGDEETQNNENSTSTDFAVSVNASYDPSQGSIGPIPGMFKIGFRYGYSPDYGDDFHNGIDMYPSNADGNLPDDWDKPTCEGFPVVSMCNGTVIEARRNYTGTTGNCVVIKSTDKGSSDYYFLYMHLQNVADGINAGGTVIQGDIIGTIGNTGDSSAPHLHFGIETSLWHHETAENPAVIMNIHPDKDMHNAEDKSQYIYENSLFNLASVDDTSSSEETENKEEESGKGYGRGIKTRDRVNMPDNKINRQINFIKNQGNDPRLIANRRISEQLEHRRLGKNSSNKNIDDYYNSIEPNPIPVITVTGRGKSSSNNYNNYKQNKYKNITPGYDNNVDYYSNNIINSNVLDNSQLISILEVIADNSNKTDQIIQLLAAIVSNTNIKNSSSNSTNKINKLISQLRNNGSSNAPLTGLSNIINNDSKNIADAVYTIAKS